MASIVTLITFALARLPLCDLFLPKCAQTISSDDLPKQVAGLTAAAAVHWEDLDENQATRRADVRGGQ
jgi:hypothetical protein